MKKIIFFLVVFIPFVNMSSAQTELTKIEMEGKVYQVCKKFPEAIIGEYLYQKKGAPRVQLNNDGGGYFQRTGVKPHLIEFWICCDEKGEVIKTYSLDGNYKVTVIYRYLDEDVRALWGEYEIMDINIAYDKGFAIIMEERFHQLRK